MKPAVAAIAILLLVLSACDRRGPSGVVPVSALRAIALFDRDCAICHGQRGDGRGPRRASLYNKPPDFRDPRWRAQQTLGQIEATIRDGIPGSDMPGWSRLSDSEIAGLAKHVLSFGDRAAAR